MGEPTEVQERAWPAIARGDHVLVSAPTGTGKTLAAFLWGIDRLVTGAWPAGKVRILYVSPLKALNADIQRNLLAPLAALEARFREAGESFPRIRALTRSGDTPAADRRRMLANPPEILITTPESLNLIIAGPSSRLMLDGIASVILDEIHAVAATKRGTHLATAVERIVPLAGEFQRIALSATVKPLSAVADLVGGWKRLPAEGAGEAAVREEAGAGHPLPAGQGLRPHHLVSRGRSPCRAPRAGRAPKAGRTQDGTSRSGTPSPRGAGGSSRTAGPPSFSSTPAGTRRSLPG